MSLRGRFTGSKSSSSSSLYTAPPPVNKPSQPLKKQSTLQTNQTIQAQPSANSKSPSTTIKSTQLPTSCIRPAQHLPTIIPPHNENLPIPQHSSRIQSSLSISTTPTSSTPTSFCTQDLPAYRRAMTTNNNSNNHGNNNNNDQNAPITPSGAIVPMGLEQYITTHPLWNYRLNPLNIQVNQPNNNFPVTTNNNNNPAVHEMFTPFSIDPSVKVVLRVRPPNKTEIQHSQGPRTNSNSNPIHSSSFPLGFSSNNNIGQDEVFTAISPYSATPSAQYCNQRYHFDLVLSPAHSQNDVFENVGKPMLSAFLQGYNTTMFVYGQSGSGKTHTIYGSVPTATSESTSINTPNFEVGIIPRSLNHIYQQLNEASLSIKSNANNSDGNLNIPRSFEWKTYCSLLEVYNDRVFDLFDMTNSKASQDAEKNCQSVETANDNECLHLLQDGLKKRKVASTLLNSSSSRSHLVFILYLSTTTTTAQGATIIHNSKLTLIDLAGSERVRKSGVLNEHLGGNSEQLDEATHINKSLSHLSTVISQINANNESGASTFVPYRNSALTRLLRDSLGGNSVTCVIACVSPSRVQEQETVSTIRFAQGARRIKNAVALNEIKRQEAARELSGLEQQRLLDYENTIALNKQQHDKLLSVLQVLLSQRNRFKDILLGAKLLARPIEDLIKNDTDDTSSDGTVAIAQDLLSYFANAKLDHLLTTSHELFDEQGETAQENVQSDQIKFNGMSYNDFLLLFDPTQTQPSLAYPVPNQLSLFESTRELMNDILAQGVQLGQLNDIQSNFLLEFQLTKLQQEYSNLQETHGMLIADYKSVCNENEDNIFRIEKLEFDSQNQQQIIAVQQTTIETLEDELSVVREENLEHKSTIQALTRSLADLQHQFNTVQDNFDLKIIECGGLIEEIEKKDDTIQRCEKKINKLVDGIKQVMTHNKILEADIKVHQETITTHLQTISLQKDNMASLQELHNKYITELQEQHQSVEQRQEELITALTTQVQNHFDNIIKLSSQIQQCEGTIEMLQQGSQKLQDDYNLQLNDLQQLQLHLQRLTLHIATVEQQLAETRKEGEQLFNINLSLSSHNNDQQKIKMQEILRERLKTAENKLREKELAFDELHQKYFIQFQRSKLFNSEIPKVTTATTSNNSSCNPKPIGAMIDIDFPLIKDTSSTDFQVSDYQPVPSPVHAPLAIPLNTQQLSGDILHDSQSLTNSNLVAPVLTITTTTTATTPTATLITPSLQQLSNRGIIPLTTAPISQRNIPTKSLKHKQPIGGK